MLPLLLYTQKYPNSSFFIYKLFSHQNHKAKRYFDSMSYVPTAYLSAFCLLVSLTVFCGYVIFRLVNSIKSSKLQSLLLNFLLIFGRFQQTKSRQAMQKKKIKGVNFHSNDIFSTAIFFLVYNRSQSVGNVSAFELLLDFLLTVAAIIGGWIGKRRMKEETERF